MTDHSNCEMVFTETELSESTRENGIYNDLSSSSFGEVILDAVVEPVYRYTTQTSHPPPALAIAVDDEALNESGSSTVTTTRGPHRKSTRLRLAALLALAVAAFSVLSACLVIVLRDDTKAERLASQRQQVNYDDRLVEATNLLIESGLATPSSFAEVTSARSRALDWCVYKDLTIWTHIGSSTSLLAETESRERFLRRYALILLAYSTSVVLWNQSVLWVDLVEAHECSFPGVECDANDRIASISMSSWRLSGSIPEEMGMILTDLIRLDLSLNKLEGSIPESLYDMERLESLNLSNNRLSSTISSKIGKLTNLKEWYVHYNFLTGALPIEAFRQLKQIKAFAGLGNRVEGNVLDVVESWTQLEMIAITNTASDNGSIPTTIGQLSLLRELVIENFDPVIPTEIGLLTNLEFFYFEIERPINASQFLSTLPTELGMLTNLKDLSIESNYGIAGTIPTELGRLTNLGHLNLQGNNFTGELPTSIGQLSFLRTISVAYCNNLRGTVPQEYGNIAPSMLDFQIFGTQLEGDLPREFCSSEKVEIEMDCRRVSCECCLNVLCW